MNSSFLFLSAILGWGPVLLPLQNSTLLCPVHFSFLIGIACHIVMVRAEVLFLFFFSYLAIKNLDETTVKHHLASASSTWRAKRDAFMLLSHRNVHRNPLQLFFPQFRLEVFEEQSRNIRKIFDSIRTRTSIFELALHPKLFYSHSSRRNLSPTTY